MHTGLVNTMDDTLSRMNSLLGDDMLIASLQKSFQFTDEPKFFQYTAFMNKQLLNNSVDDENHGSGLSLTEHEAKIKAMGECIERFDLSLNADLNKKSSFNNLTNAVDPVLFINNEEVTNELIKKIRETDFYWSEAINLFTNQSVYIPSQLIYVPYAQKEFVLRLPISSGAACASSKDEAIYKGICELIERDAFMLCYLQKHSPTRIAIDSISDSSLNEIIEKMKRYFLEPHFFSITTDVAIPTILCVIVDKSGVGPAISIGTKTDWDVILAAKGAILEAQHTRLWIRYQLLEGKSAPDKDKINSLEDRGLFWSSLSMISNLDFILKTSIEKNIEEFILNVNKTDYLKNVLSILQDHKFSVYAKDLTSQLTESAGFVVFKVVIPQLHPLYLFENFKYLYGSRLTSEKLNEVPHPFV